MRVELFDYYLPPELIAQTPIEPRDSSRLMVVERGSGRISHLRFSDLPDLLMAEDLLVLNRSRVRKARLLGIKAETGARVELLLLRPLDLGKERWEALGKPARRLKPGSRVICSGGELVVEILENRGGGELLVRMILPQGEDAERLLEQYGKVPLPPYIKGELEEEERYQTVFGEEPGSVAAPTAGLHFTPGLLRTIEEKGMRLAFVDLRIGLDTFQPVREERVEDHRVHSEEMKVSAEVCRAIDAVREDGGRVVAVGTTVVRALETAAVKGRRTAPFEGVTNLFIYPGYRFQVVDALLTNFHLPRSSLLMLVCAFGGRELILSAYRKAIEERYRFYSFGDAMFIY
jgi:S-adenosylmethionine:tRNA ribosyltransferase-isomerase